MKEDAYSDGTWRIATESASLPDGRVKTVSRVHRCDSAHVIAFVDDASILLLREYRPFYGDYIWMLPSGRIDKEGNPVEQAQRELREETGFAATQIELYCTAHNTESVAYANHIFIAHDLYQSPLPQDGDELIEVHTFPLEFALEKVLDKSRVVHTPSAFGLLRYIRDFS